MGYRSDVACVTAFTRPPEARAFYEKQMKELGELVVSDKRNSYSWMSGHINLHGKYVVFECNQLKWYPDYEDVMWLEAMFEEARNTNGYVGQRFIRLGESDDDNEIRDFDDAPWETLTFDRSIDIDVSARDGLKEVEDGPDC